MGSSGFGSCILGFSLPGRLQRKSTRALPTKEVVGIYMNCIYYIGFLRGFL